MLTTTLTLAYLMLTATGMALFWRYRAGSPIFWYQAALALMAIGTFFHTSSALESDRTYIFISFVAHVVFLVVSLMVAAALDTRGAFLAFSRKDHSEGPDNAFPITLAMFVLSALITLLYYYLIGYNVLLLLAGGSDIDYSTARLETYSGDRYFAPGYVNQFKNVLLPLTALLIAIRLKRQGRNQAFAIFVAVALPLVLLALGGTGQRAFVLYTGAAGVFGYFLSQTGRSDGVSKVKIAAAASPVVILFIAMTSFYATGADDDNVILTALSRFTSIQQEGGLFGFQYIYPLPIAWFSEWWQGLVGILPGFEGSTLAHDIYGALYGTTRGTAPLSAIGSAYYNGGVLGVILLFTALGILYTYLYTRFLRGERTYYRSYSYGFMFLYLSIYVTDSPTILLDNGIVAIAGFLLLIRGSSRHHARRAGQDAPAPRYAG